MTGLYVAWCSLGTLHHQSKCCRGDDSTHQQHQAHGNDGKYWKVKESSMLKGENFDCKVLIFFCPREKNSIYEIYSDN